MTGPGDHDFTQAILDWGVGQIGLRSFTIQRVGDVAWEPNETIVLELFSCSDDALALGATLGSPSGAVLLIDDSKDNLALVFQDGFESGATSAWDFTTP